MKKLISKLILTALIFTSCDNTSSNYDNNNGALNTTQQEQSNKEPTTSVKDYSGNYYDLDESTGWETRVSISGQSFSAVTVNPITGEGIANTSGKLEGTNLIDEYGQTIGNVFEHSISINFGNASIDCRKR